MERHPPRRAAAREAGRATVPPPVDDPRSRGPRDGGSVLLETAVAIPLLVAVAAALAWALSLAATAMGLADTARMAARDIARGVPPAEAVATAQQATPGATVRVESGAATVTVIVEQDVSAPVPILRGLVIPVRQAVTVPTEWT